MDKTYNIWYYDTDGEWADCSIDYDTIDEALKAAKKDATAKYSKLEIIENVKVTRYVVTPRVSVQVKKV